MGIFYLVMGSFCSFSQTYHNLASGNFSQNWTNTGLITTNDIWTGVPSIIGYLGDDASTTTNPYNPQTALVAFTTVDVIANQTSTNITNGGVAEFELTDPVVALQGSGTADAPNLVIFLNATGRQNIQFSCNLRDIDGSMDNAIQPIAFQYRIGATGNFINIPAAFVADATTGPSLATLVTPVAFTLPSACDNQAQVEIRIITGNAMGNDEWVGVDDISVTSDSQGSTPNLSINDVSLSEGNAGTTTFTFTVSLSAPAGAGGVTFDIATADGTATQPSDYTSKSLTGQTIPAGSSTYTFDVLVNGDATTEPNETFFVNVTNVTGATVADGQGQGTIVNDDITLTPIHDIQGPGLLLPL
ncbi:MAG: Calx-beta domain-containing protein [Spirosomataceae bacterium]